MRKDPLRLATHILVYTALFILCTTVFGWVLIGTGPGEPGAYYLFGITATSLLAAGVTNWLTMRIYEHRGLADLGLWWNRASSANFAMGLAGGIGSACVVLVPPLLARVARLGPRAGEHATPDMLVFFVVLLTAGAAGEELLFRGYGFQLLLAAAGPYATILPVGVVFALLHTANPNATWFGIANTAGFGILFGYAYLRSRDLWLPIGLHLGWNLTLPVFGVNLSGLKMSVTGYEMSWTAGRLWSGGAYGPEASILTSAVVVLLFFYVWKLPVRRQVSPLTDPPAENAVCEHLPSLLP